MLLVLCLLLTLFACSNTDQEAIYSSALAEGKGESAENAVQSVQSMAPASEDDLSGELTLRTPVAGDTLNYYAIFFHQLHPNVTIHVEPTFTDAAEWARNPQRHTEQLAVELMSGEAGDLVDIGMMTYAKYASSGLFEDLNQWMDNDPDIHREDFYQNVLGELEIDGELFQMPVNWNYITLYFNLNMTTDLGVDVQKRFPDGVNYKQAVELFEEMKEAGDHHGGDVFRAQPKRRVLRRNRGRRLRRSGDRHLHLRLPGVCRLLRGRGQSAVGPHYEARHGLRFELDHV